MMALGLLQVKQQIANTADVFSDMFYFSRLACLLNTPIRVKRFKNKVHLFLTDIIFPTFQAKQDTQCIM